MLSGSEAFLGIAASSNKPIQPTILVLLGWQLFFYANEGNGPIHVHCEKAMWSAGIGLMKKIPIYQRPILMACHHEIRNKYEKSYLNASITL